MNYDKHCDSCIACQLNKLKKENKQLKIEDERHHQYISKGATLAGNQRLKIEQFKEENEELKKERTEIFEHVAKWLDSKAEWFQALENFIEECQGKQ